MAAATEVERQVSGDDEGALVVRARAGDRDAAEALLLRHEITVHRACAHLLPRGDDVEAAVQETFVRALRSLAHPAGGTRSLYGPDGIVAGTGRAEKLLFWPLGIRDAGATRQWGRHATAFVGRRHFDDALLLDRYFAPAPR